MTARLFSTQDTTAPKVQLNKGERTGSPFAVVYLNDVTYLSFTTPEEAFAMRDACDRAGHLLLDQAEGSAP